MSEPIQDACHYTAGLGQWGLSLKMIGTFVLVSVSLYALHIAPGAEQPDKAGVAADPADKYPGLHLIPWPNTVQLGQGRMKVTAASRIVVSQKELTPLAKVLSSEIALLTGLKLKVATDAGQPGDMVLKINKAL